MSWLKIPDPRESAKELGIGVVIALVILCFYPLFKMIPESKLGAVYIACWRVAIPSIIICLACMALGFKNWVSKRMRPLWFLTMALSFIAFAVSAVFFILLKVRFG